MVRTGGTLKPKLINLIGQLDQKETLININKDITALEKKLKQENKKLKIDVELFGNVKDIAKNISDLQKKLEASPSFKDIKIGVALEDVNVKEINEQIGKVQEKFNQAKTANKLKLDVEFDFTGSASKIKEEMEGIRQFMARYGEQMKNMDIVNLDKDAENAKRNAGGIKTSIQTMGQGIDKVSNDIEADMRKMTTSSGKFGVTFERDVSGAIKSATGTLTSANGTIEKFKYNVDSTSGELVHMSTNTKVAGDQQERLEKAIKQTDDAQRKLNQAMKTAPDNMPSELAEIAQGHINSARAMQEHGQVTDKGMASLTNFDNTLAKLNQTSKSLAIANEFQETQHATRQMIEEFGRMGQLAPEDVRRLKASVSDVSNDSTEKLKMLQNEVMETARDFTSASSEIEQAMNKLSASSRKEFTGAIKDGDIATVKRYVEELYGAEVASIRLSEKKDKLGQSVTRVAVGMKEVDGAVKSYTLDMNRADGSLKEVNASTKELNASNKDLEGGFGTILSRITQYFGAMQLVQQAMRGMREIYQEIRDIDAGMIELARVADPSLNLDSMLKSSVSLSKELGANVQDVLEVVGDMARTFGEFNEEQILAISRTATIMTNVSDFSLKESGDTLVGTMQAFNITAEDSIRIVNVLNEVDNNYAISTRQLGDAISRAGATASVFGANLEEISGHITAVGAVTQESGERIGTALRTIYSRITTHKDSIEVLDELGISMRTMGEQGQELRSVTDILGDLAIKWQDMSREQQQSTALAIAGRNRLTQFIALMNNYDMAIDATTSAMNSQGSAMREQEQYMQSYEYGFTVLGASVTELALVIEDKLVGDALYLFTNTATSVVESLTAMIDKFGALPVILGGVTTAFLVFGKGTSKMLMDGVGSAIETIGLSMMELNGVTKKAGGALLDVFASLGPFTGLLTGGVIVAGVAGIGYAIEKVIAKTAEQKRITEEATRSLSNSLEMYNLHGNNIKEMINRYDDLSVAMVNNKEAMTTDEIREYNTLVEDLSTLMPHAVSHIDAQGQAHLKGAGYMRRQSEELEKLSEISKGFIEVETSKVFKEQAKELQKLTEVMNNAILSAERYREAQENIRNDEGLGLDDRLNNWASRNIDPTVNRIADAFGWDREAHLANQELEKLNQSLQHNAEATARARALQFEMKGAIQETITTISNQSVALLNAEGVLENVSSAGQTTIRTFTSAREEILSEVANSGLKGDELVEAWEDAQNLIKGQTLEFGNTIVALYDDVAKRAGDSGVQMLDTILTSIPDDLLTGKAEDVNNTMNIIGRAITDISTNANIDIDSMISTFVGLGMSTNDASKLVIAFGREMNNQSVQIALAEDGLTSYNDELTHTRDLALETIEPLSVLFGIDSEQMNAMDSHIQTLQILRQQYGDTWYEMDQGKASIQGLASEFGVSESFIISNLDEMGQAIRAMNTATSKWSDELGMYVWEFDESVSESTRNLVMELNKNGDEYEGFVREYVKQNGIVQHSQEELAGFTKDLNDRFQEFAKGPQDTNNWNLLMTDLKGQLEHLYGTFAVVEDEFGNLKFQLADGTESEYFNNLTKQLQDSGLEVELLVDETDGLLKLMATDLEGNLHPLALIDEYAQSGAFSVGKTEEAVKGLINTATSKENKETFLQTLNNQLEVFGEGLITTNTEAGELVLAFENGGTSPWLETMNTLIGELGLELDLTEDMLGNLHISLQTKEGETIFTQVTTEASEAKKEVEKVDEKVDEVTQKEREPISMYVDKRDVDEKVEEVDTQVDEAIEKEREPISMYVDKTDVEEKTNEVEVELNELANNPYSAYLDLNKETADEKAGEAEEKLSDLEKERIAELKLNFDEDNFNGLVEKIGDVRGELLDIDAELVDMENILRATNEQFGNLMTNTENINNARNAIRSLKDDVDEAIIKMGELYAKFADGGIDTSGFQTDANTILSTVAGVEENVRRLQRAVASLNSTMGALNEAFDISPMVAYRAGMAVHATGIESRMGELSGFIRNAFNAINASLMKGTQDLDRAVSSTSDALGRMTTLYRLTKEMVVRYIEEMGISITQDYIETVTRIIATTQSFNKSMDIGFSAIATTVRDRMQRMGIDMNSIFTSSVEKLVGTARTIPRLIGDGITANMSGATNSMASLASNMVRRFKTELGIRSPSRVFEQLGGDVIDGLVNGLSGSDITNLGQSVFSDFSDGAIATIDQIKGYMTFDPVSAGSFGGAFSMTSGYGNRKSPGNGIGSTNHRGVDFGAPMGTAIPSQSSGRVVASGWMGGLGNAVIIESAGGVQHVYGHNSANYVSVGQTVGRGQAIGAVGSTGNSTGPHVHYEVRVNGVAVDPRKRLRGFAKGGFVDSEELAFVGEEGLEAIIPLMPHRKERGLDLWAETGEILGMNSSLLEMLIRSQRRSGSFSSGGGFSGLDGEAGGGETATATSGTIAPDYGTIMRSLGTADQPMFSGMASSNRDEMESLYRRDMHAINVGRFSSMLTKANTELSALMENTLKYRNALEEVNYQERRLRDATQKQLNASIKRQSQIEKELGKLRNTSKHTVDQRKKYNELQQEFDRNSESIMSMENEIRKLNISMDQRKVEIYTDYIGQLTKGFEDLTNAIDKTISDLQFSLDYLTLTDENNIGAQLKIQYDVLRESIRLENTLMNNVNKLQAEYSKAVSKYGRNSQQALLAREELYSAESNYQSSVLNRVKLEQNVAKTREDVANEGIDTLKSYYKQTQTMTERAIELERKALEKHHENKMSMYDDEIAKIESVYDTRIAEMDAQEAEESYNETISDLNTQRAELMQQISRASRDTSLEGRKRLAELQSQLGEVNSEMETAQRDRQDQLYREAIERQKQEQIQAVEMQKERAEMEQEIRLESLDQQLADAQNYAERMINDEAMWERLRSEFIAGNGTGLASMTNEMTEQMSRFMSGDFRAVSMGYSELSDEDRDLFSEDTLLEISNLMLQSSESMERFVSTANENVQNIGYVAGRDYNAGAITTGRTGNISTQAKSGPTIPPAPKPAPKPVADNRHYTIKRGDTLWDLAQKYYGNPYQWTKIAQANANPDPRRLQIGRKLIIPFDTGGYTGDWMGDEGRVALLHKKELVLNESQTRDILDVAKIVDKISGFIPRISASKPNLGSGSVTNTGDNYNLETLVLEIPDFKGDEKDARRVFDNMAKSLKKLGK